jgi:hypothetical protein
LNDVPGQIQLDSRAADTRVDSFGGRLAAAQFNRIELFLQIVGLGQFSVFLVVLATSLSVQFPSAFRATGLLAINVPNVGKKPPLADLAASFSRFDFWHRRISIKQYGDTIPRDESSGQG